MTSRLSTGWLFHPKPLPMPDPNNTAIQEPNKPDIQGLIIRGYTHPCSVHMMFKFANAQVASDFFKPLIPYLQSAAPWVTKPDIMLNIGLTWGGINMVRPALKATNFPPDFVNGPQGPAPAGTPNPQATLCDTGPSDPANWWNKKFITQDVHCVVHAYAMDYDAQAKVVKIISDAAASTKGGVTELFPSTSPSGRYEQYPFLPYNTIHFAYLDSIDEPALDPDPPKPDQQNLNNFLIGYSPVALPGPTTGPEGAFAINGCYNAFRVLFQDVPAFGKYLDDNAPAIAVRLNKPLVYAREWLAAKLCGRWRNGSPLIISPDMPDEKTIEVSEFSYTGDPKGMRCPFQAHTRVTNPRDGSIFPGDSPVPHLIRRGVPYGAPAGQNNPDEDRGLIGLFLCGDIASQFQKIYGWVNMNDFSKVFPWPHITQDALIANRTPPPGAKTDTSFTIPMEDGPPIKLKNLPQLVVTRGTAYCLLPSISTIKSIAGVA
ncbi:hypothetical protein BH09BAC6_BH09BAC6_05290 [soil metagenome]